MLDTGKVGPGRLHQWNGYLAFVAFSTSRAAQFFELQYAELEFITRQVIAELSRGRAGRGWERLGVAVWET